MNRQRELRDPIHGFIQRSEIEEKIVDTPLFQRLRGIKQLAMAHLVYPGAMHTRFDHSLGVMHIAKQLARQLIEDEDNRRIVSLAALLHDIGHGPFSHVSEDLLDRYYDEASVKPQDKEKIHERVTVDIILQHPELARYISDFDREKIIGLLRGSAGESIARSVISGPLDADKQDYLLRDSYFCGVKYGVFDSARLIGTLQVYSEHHDRHLAASSGGIYAIEQFVLAKYHMSTQVYRHKIRLITDSMIGRALELGIEHDSLSWLRDLYAYNGSPEFISNYLGWDDARLVTEICRSKNTLTRELFLRLKERRLLKIVFDIPLPEVEDPKVRNFLAELRKRNDFRTRLEQDVSDYLSKKLGMAVPPHEVIARTYAIKSVREESRNNEGKIMILSEDGSRASFEEKSTLFRSIDQKWNDQFLQVYAPVVYEDDVKKRRMKEEFAQDIGRIVMDLASSQVKPGNTQQEEDHGAQRP